jgi:hypothetical protein
MKLTQKQLILEYLKEHDFILPAKMSGKVYKGVMFGSEISRRARELRAEGILSSVGEKRFEKFYLSNMEMVHGLL